MNEAAAESKPTYDATDNLKYQEALDEVKSTRESLDNIINETFKSTPTAYRHNIRLAFRAMLKKLIKDIG